MRSLLCCILKENKVIRKRTSQWLNILKMSIKNWYFKFEIQFLRMVNKQTFWAFYFITNTLRLKRSRSNSRGCFYYKFMKCVAELFLFLTKSLSKVNTLKNDKPMNTCFYASLGEFSCVSFMGKHWTQSTVSYIKRRRFCEESNIKRVALVDCGEEIPTDGGQRREARAADRS